MTISNVLRVLLATTALLLASLDNVQASMVVIWEGFSSNGIIGTIEQSNQRCFDSAADGWLPGGCQPNKSFAFLEYSSRSYDNIPSLFNFSSSLPVYRGNRSGTPGPLISNTWTGLYNGAVLENPITTSDRLFWTGRIFPFPGGYPEINRCNDWSAVDEGGSCEPAGFVYKGNCNPFITIESGCAYNSCCSGQKPVLCGCHYSPPTSAPSKAPTKSPTRSPTLSLNIPMVSTTITVNGCGASTPNSLPFAPANGACTKIGPTTSAVANCDGTTPSVVLFDNDDGTCTSATRQTYPIACQSVTGPGPNGPLTMGFGFSCQNIPKEDLLKLSIYEGTCSAKTKPMISYWRLNSCMSPPGFPTPEGVIGAPFSMYLQAFGTPDKVFLWTRTWTNSACQGAPATSLTTLLAASDGQAVVGCTEGNPHNVAGVTGTRRSLTTVATEFTLFAIPANMSLTSSAEVTSHNPSVKLASAIIFSLVMFLMT